MKEELTPGFAIVILFCTSVMALLGGIGSTVLLEGFQAAIAASIMVFMVSLVTFFSVRHLTQKEKGR